METIRTEKKPTPKTASTLTLLKLSLVFASLASRDSLDSITEGQLSTSSRGNTILKRASSMLRASSTWRSSSMLTCVISWDCWHALTMYWDFSILNTILTMP